MKKFTLKNNQLFVGAGKPVQFKFPVAEFLEFDDIAVVRLNVPTDKVFNENVFGVSSHGEPLWQISKRKYVYENSPYMHLSIHQSYVRAHNWDCLDLILEPKTGAVIDRIQSK